VGESESGPRLSAGFRRCGLDAERYALQVFTLRSIASGAAFHRAYPRATQQAFLEGHELAFQHLGGVYRRLRYDNLGSAVRKILRGHRREETTRFLRLASVFRVRHLCHSSLCHLCFISASSLSAIVPRAMSDELSLSPLVRVLGLCDRNSRQAGHQSDAFAVLRTGVY
jgi:hypothetical protein